MYKGVLTKMLTQLNDPIDYYLNFDRDFIHLNQVIGKEISIKLTGYECLECSKKVNIFAQGFCYNCFTTSAKAGQWIIRPELSEAHLGKQDRDLDYESGMQLQPHVVYLAKSSDFKIGVTRLSQLPTRWIDQGADQAIVLLQTPNRYLAGVIEVELKNHFKDKISWQKMLKDSYQVDFSVLEKKKEEILNLISNSLKNEIKEDHFRLLLSYPLKAYPTKIKSLNLEKQPQFSGVLKGIKGQYLIFESGLVFNVRSHQGYCVDLSINSLNKKEI